MFDWVLNAPLFYVFIVSDRDTSDIIDLALVSSCEL